MRKDVLIILLTSIGVGIALAWIIFPPKTGKVSMSAQQVFLTANTNNMNDAPEMRVFKNVDYVWDRIEEGGGYQKGGELELAAKTYLIGYKGSLGSSEPITPGQAVAGMRLIEVYEQLGRFDDGLKIVDELDNKYANGEYGHQKMQDIRSRLLAAKNTSQK